MKKFLIIVMSIAALADCAGQSCSMLKGSVFDLNTNELLPGASIRSLKYPGLGTRTNENGAFEISSMQQDTLIITFIGYTEQMIPVQSIAECFHNVYLETTARHIDAVVIKGERIIAEEFTIRKIRKLDIYTNPSAKADPILAVNATPSATTTDESANISLRGGSPAETGIFLNNVPINDAVRYSQLNGMGTFSVFNTALINNVQVYPGNPPLEYGNSTSGLIALQTDEDIPSKNTTMVSLTLASAGGYTSRKLNDRSSLTMFANYQPSVFITALNSEALKDLKKFSSVDLGIHYYNKLSDKAAVKIFNYSLIESYKFHYVQPTYDGNFYQRKRRNFTIGNFRKKIGANTNFSFNQGISFSQADYNYGTTNIELNLHDLFSSINIHHTGNTTEWKTGISYDHKASAFEGTFPLYDFAVGEDHPVDQGSAHDHVGNPEWYGYVKRYLGSKWVLGGGLRKNIAIEGLKDYLSIQGNIHYKPNEFWKLNLSAGKYHKYQLPQGESSEPFLIQSRQYSLDVTHNRSTLENSLSVFYKISELNEAKTTVKGIEVFTRCKINGNMRLQISLTSLNASTTAYERSTPSPYNIHYFLRGNFEYKIQGTWTMTTVFLFRQGSYYHPVAETSYNATLNVYEPLYSPTPERLPSYNTIDFSISKIFPFTKASTGIAFLSAGNIVNFKNVRAYTYNFDYTQRKEYLFSQRVLYMGLIINF